MKLSKRAQGVIEDAGLMNGNGIDLKRLEDAVRSLSILRRHNCGKETFKELQRFVGLEEVKQPCPTCGQGRYVWIKTPDAI